MRVLVINPVGHSTWNESDRVLYKRFLPSDVHVDVVSLPRGPTTVETAEAYREAAALVVERGRELFSGYDGTIVNCFLDPGVEELRYETKSVVIGAGEASLTLAKLYGHPIYIITVGAEEETLNLMWERVVKLGFEKIVADIVGVPFGVMDIDRDRERTLSLLFNAAKSVTSKRSGEKVTIVLGCTGFGGIAEELQNLVKMPVVDPVKASALLMVSLLRLLLKD
ncbi:MAG: aspartate/glutamate racemase family protein [Desulfurococcaceae archaeon]